MFINDQSDAQANESAMLARKQWATPIVDVHMVEELTMAGTGGGADASNSHTHS